ncbi:MAG: pyruvate kinase [Turicibacter sp.]|jgi:pyruvate kinase|uniref:Pyruvate kinase n=1 Tax=Turicibacter faecis TaxID=2963365 RepID=A0ABN6ZJI6_9FIRM|nr:MULTISPECIES: pyruvate kinase [unclassified Turicibacter]MCI8700950.1 pyruvate kinase [Turicibacter sp.]BEH91482.1 pyruvate kinase [Turicibacter sp. TC023]MCI9350583.1 pyruvate kinase [Turicibacter sp.]MCU7204876.1 pyruvate kinase [Turicibacter sp. TA25]MCU7208431.1 pyruvate kinase [Turicibacter sp. 1E2]
MKHTFKNTKMICTIGPKSESKEMLSKLVDAGMNCVRCNFSHGDHAEQKARMDLIREINKEKGTHVAVLLDTKGPEIRTHLFENGGVDLVAGQTVRVAMNEVLGTAEKFSITYPGLINDVEVGGTILVDDGYVTLTVNELDTANQEIVCTVQNPAYIKDRRGINVPGAKLNMPFISEKDHADLVFGCEMEVDYVAASFVRRAEDVLAIREIFKQHGNTHTQIIAKIENQEGVDNMDSILEVVDGIMVARGDLGVEVPAEDVPLIQKEIIAKCNAAGKIVVTATQMLESMQKNPRPTRAEVSDVANAIFDGSDAIMLSGESAAGQYPLEAVETMARIARRTEQALDHQELIARAIASSTRNVASAMGLAVADTVEDLGAKAVIACTQSGATARAISKYRPSAPVVAATSCEKTAASLALYWGVQPVVVAETSNTDELLETAAKVAEDFAGLEAGEIAVVTAGLPAGEGNTNLMKIHEVK